LFSQAARWWYGPLSRWKARALAGVAGGQLMATPWLHDWPMSFGSIDHSDSRAQDAAGIRTMVMLPPLEAADLLVR
jgi:hypothetical protein